MTDPNPELVESLLEDFVARLRRGEAPAISAYEAAHPECAEQIREFFPVALAIEQIALQRQHHGPPAAAIRAPERLGDFRIVREIGRGGMGIVYEAEQESLARHVAVKVLPQSALLNPVALQRFEREARTAAQLHHTNIVPVFGVGEQQGFHYIVMQLIQGVGLDKLLQQLAYDCRAEGSGGLPPQAPAAKEGAGDVTAVGQALMRGEFRHARATGGSSARLAAVLPGSGHRPPHSAPTAPLQKPPVAAPAAAAPPRSGPPLPPPPPRAAGKPPLVANAVPPRLGLRYWQSIAQLGAQAADALHYAHQRGTLHRDIKPANLLVDLQGVVWITDFGLARAMEHDEVSRTGDIVGTLRYMAPERFHGEADARSDIYSLGLTLYELLTLRPAYEQSSPSVLMRRISHEPPVRPRALNPSIPRDLETIVLKAVAREPVHRYPSAEELADDLARFLEDQPIRARRLSVAERLWRWARRNRAVASLLGLAAALLVLVAVVASVGYVRTTRANALVREALAGQSQQREKAEALSALTLEALDDIFEQYVPNRIAGAGELSLDDGEGSAVRLSAPPALSKGTAALLERMLAFYNRLAQQNAADAGLRRKAADANRRVGDIHRRLGHVEQAQAAYLKAIQANEQFQRDASGNAAVATEIARINNELGDLQWAARSADDGRGRHAAALKLLQAASPAQAALAAHRYELARTHYFLGRGGPPDAAPGRGGPPDHGPPGEGPRRPRRDREGPGAAPRRTADDESLRRAIGILERLIAEHPAAAEYRRLLACCYRDLPSRPSAASPQEAFASADKAIEILRKLATDFPDVPDYRFDLSKTYAEVALPDRQPNAALTAAIEERLRQSLLLSERLMAENPNVPEYAASHVHSLYLLTESLRFSRRPNEAETTLRKALALQSTLAEQFPTVNSYLAWQAILQESLAKMLADRGLATEARTLLDSALATLDQVLKRDPQAAGYVHNLQGRCDRNLAEVLTQLGQPEKAAEVFRRARERRGGK